MSETDESDSILIDPDALERDLVRNQRELQDIGEDVMHLAKQIKKTKRELQKVKEGIGTPDAEDKASGVAE